MRSIAFKLWFGITGLVLIILCIMWMFQVIFLKQYYIYEKKVALENYSSNIIEAIEKHHGVDNAKFESFDFINEICQKTNSKAIILDKNFEVVYFNSASSDRPPYILDKKKDSKKESTVTDLTMQNAVGFIVEPKKANYSLEKTMREYDISKKMLKRAPIIYVGDVQKKEQGIVAVKRIKRSQGEGYVVLATPFASIDSVVSTLKEQLTLISTISLIIGTLMAFAFSSNAIRPIKRLQNAMKQIATGDFNTRVLVTSDDEIGNLGRSVNDMVTELGKMEGFRRDFIANVTHELKTPLAIISAYAELVKESPEMTANEYQQYMEDIMEESERLNGMVEEILALSKLESQLGKVEIKPVQVVSIVQEAVRMLAMPCQNKQMAITVSMDCKLRVLGDEEGLRKIFVNIIGNAISHCPVGTHIHVFQQESSEAECVELHVKDTGQGISPDELPNIWKRFYKVDKTGKRNTKGTGLGLSIVETILKSHGASCHVESVLGKGTDFSFKYRVATQEN